jgi:hypothetical protein
LKPFICVSIEDMSWLSDASELSRALIALAGVGALAPVPDEAEVMSVEVAAGADVFMLVSSAGFLETDQMTTAKMIIITMPKRAFPVEVIENME